MHSQPPEQVPASTYFVAKVIEMRTSDALGSQTRGDRDPIAELISYSSQLRRRSRELTRKLYRIRQEVAEIRSSQQGRLDYNRRAA